MKSILKKQISSRILGTTTTAKLGPCSWVCCSAFGTSTTEMFQKIDMLHSFRCFELTFRVLKEFLLKNPYFQQISKPSLRKHEGKVFIRQSILSFKNTSTVTINYNIHIICNTYNIYTYIHIFLNNKDPISEKE